MLDWRLADEYVADKPTIRTQHWCGGRQTRFGLLGTTSIQDNPKINGGVVVEVHAVTVFVHTLD